jgi:hypothetical protein
VTDDGLGVWFTIQVSPHSLIQEALFERRDRPPTDAETALWLTVLMPGRQPVEAPGLPGALARRFEVFEQRPDAPSPPSAPAGGGRAPAG